MPLQSQALKALSTRYADGHPLETCGLHLKKRKTKEKKEEKLPQQQIREAAARREGEKEGGRPCPPQPTSITELLLLEYTGV